MLREKQKVNVDVKRIDTKNLTIQRQWTLLVITQNIIGIKPYLVTSNKESY